MRLRQIEKLEQPRPIFKNRPGLSVFLAVVCGMTIAYEFELVWSVAIYVVVGSILMLPVARMLRQSWLANVAGLLICFAVGLGLYSSVRHDLGSASLARYAEEGARSKITGVVGDIDETRAGHLIIIDVSTATKDSTTVELDGRLAAQLDKADSTREIAFPVIGDTITLFADVYPLRENRNPYASNYESRLKYHYKASAVAQLNSRFDYYLTPARERSLVQGLARFFDEVRERCDRILATNIPDPEASAFVRAVVLGKRGEIAESTVLDFKYTGLTHLLAISGFNIAVVSLIIAQGLLLLGIRRRGIRLPVTALGVALYCCMVGLEPSVLRAMIMIELYLFVLVIERKSDLANIAALTALGHIFVDPLIVHDAGFQLSYAAVFGFALVQPHLMHLFGDRPNDEEHGAPTFREHVRHSIILSFAAFLATTPILLFHFRQVSLVVLIANLAAIPLAAVITTLGFLIIPIGIVSSEMAWTYGTGISWLVHALLESSALLAAISAGGLQITLSTFTILALSGAMLWCLHVERKRELIRRLALTCCVGGAVVLLAGSSSSTLLPDGQLSVVFADVGQGDATILKTPSGKFYMFDFGPFSSGDPQFSARAYGPLLQVEGGDRLEAGFLTHLHRDHYGAAVSAVSSNVLSRIYTVGDRTSDEFAYGLDSIVKAEGVKVLRLSAGQVLRIEEGLSIYVLAPDSATTGSEISNDRSLALKIVYGSSSMLLLGDLEGAGERELVTRYGDHLRSDIVKVAHHGSISSSIQEIVRSSDPRFAIISCGRGNQFGHPHQRVVSRWMRSGAEVFRTDIDGALIFRSNGEKFDRVMWK